MEDNDLRDLQRLLARQDFKSRDEALAFGVSLLDKPIPKITKSELTREERAEDLIIEARQLNKDKGRNKAKEALVIDPKCVDAYDYLACHDSDPAKALELFQKGMSIVVDKMETPELYIIKGHYWEYYHTRCSMRLLSHLATLLFLIGLLDDCDTILELMLTLDTDDNLGAGILLQLHLLDAGEFGEFKKFAREKNKKTLACRAYNIALYYFMTEGETERATAKLRKAIRLNDFVIPKIIMNDIYNPPEIFGIDEESDATLYVGKARDTWFGVEGVVKWISKINDNYF